MSCNKVKEDNKKIRLGVPLQASFLPVFTAKEKGIFKKNGIDVELISNISLDELYGERKIDVICTGLTESIVFTSEGHSSKIIYRFTYSLLNDLIVANKNIKDIESLRKKRISFDGVNSSSHIFVQQLLSKKGIQEGDYLTANIPVHQVLNELEKGTIDAGHTTGISLSEITKREFNIIGRSSDDPDLLSDAMVVDSKYLESHKKELKLLVASILEANEFYEKNPEEAIQIFSNISKRNKEEIKEELNGFKFLNQNENEAALNIEKSNVDLSKSTNAPNFDLSQSPKEGARLPKEFSLEQGMQINVAEKKLGLFAAGQTIIQFLRERGQIYRMPDLESILFDEFVKASDK